MIKCIAIDDEPLALTQISNYIQKTPFLELCHCFNNATDAMEFIHVNEIDLMFLDIQMPDMTGLEFIKSMKQTPSIIFTTAYSEYAVEGFRVNALDYLLKPLDYSTFLKSANKARSYFEMKQMANKTTNQSPTISDNKNSVNSTIIIKSEYKLLQIQLSDIIFLESLREYIRIYLVNEKPIMTLCSMKKMQSQLPHENFMRVHRSYIVNLDKIKIVERNRIVFDKVRIPISEQYKVEFQAYINNHFL